jgi:hypothetical protein
MMGRYWSFGWQSPVTRNGRQIWPTRWRRRVEDQRVRRYTDTVVRDEAAAVDADNDPSDCRHGCNGDCVANGSPDDRCNFTCHPHLRQCPRCGRVCERHEFHDHENNECGGYWGCSRCTYMDTFKIVGCGDD